MLTPALVFFVLGALGGLTLAIRSESGKSLPWILTIGHGALGATGIVLVLFSVLQGDGGTFAKVSLAALIAAALGGFYLLSFHLRKKEHPVGVIVLHALIAVTGVGLLAASVFGAGS